MSRATEFLDRLRRASGDIENHVVDEFLAGRLDRRGLLMHGARVGLAAPLLAGLLGAAAPFGRARAQGKPGATIRVASAMPTTAINPVTVANTGGLVMLMQTGEFLVRDAPNLVLQPCLATSWKPNNDGTVWTFALRSGVKFHNGKTMTSADVVSTMDKLSDPKGGSNALSAFRGVLSKGGTKAVDDLTVEFHLDAPNGNFPYLVSSDNYNAIIVPADYDDFEKTFIGTGPFKLERFTTKVGANFVRNPEYWGGAVLPARTEFTFFADQQSQVLALQGKQVDVIAQVAVQGAQGLLNDPDVKLIKLRSSATREMHIRNDVPHFADKRVRQAMAMSLDRPAIVAGLFRGNADLGNDSPIAPIYPSNDPTVSQRKKDVERAKALLAEAGVPNGFEATLTCERTQEIPDYAVLMQNSCAAIGIKLTLKVEDQGAYYGSAKFGTSDWLDSEMGITSYGHRGIPNVLLNAPLVSTGTWNASHFKNPDYDKLVAAYVAATDLSVQRETAGKIDKLLLDETPSIFGYFYNQLTATSADVSGVEPTAISQVFLQHAAIA